MTQHDAEKARATIGTEQKQCRSCGAAIVWAHTVSGKRVPLDAQQTLDGNVSLTDGGLARIVGAGEGRYVSHFATCPQAATWRRKGEVRP